MKRLLATTAMALALTVPALTHQALADVVLGGQNWSFNGVDNLVLTPVVPGGNQPQNIQCIICGANQPQQSPTFGYTDFHNAGNQTTEAYFSTNVAGGANPGSNTVGVGYDGTFLRNYLIASGDPTLTFTVGVDVNDTNSPQTLTSFYLLNLTTHTVLSAFTTPTVVASQNNGTGFPDYTLGTFNITVGQDIHLGDQLIFFARIDNANDGPDSFFIQPVAVPSPVVGAGLPGILAACVGLWGLAMRRKKRAGFVT
jgi:hypothetical protein